jgi:hypothetical protein
MRVGFVFLLLFPSVLSLSSLTLYKSIPLTSLHHSPSSHNSLISSSSKTTPSSLLDESLSSSEQDPLQWVLSQKAELIEHQNNITRFLRSKHIPLGNNDDRTSGLTKIKRKTLVVESTPHNPYFCRLSLCNADPFDKLIAPCGCIGSQQVLLSLLHSPDLLPALLVGKDL